VLAFQFRFQGMWEVEKGGAPYSAFPVLSGRFPLRGYTNAWMSPFIMGLSAEYRWPVDRLVDGVVFDEYAMISDKINHWSKKQLYNSWGFGVRVRKPDMYLFRVQFAFHSWHGISLVLTIAPEFR
jgi:outer membrane protein assembly factor BamA